MIKAQALSPNLDKKAISSPAVQIIGRSAPQGRSGPSVYLKDLDYPIVQQCIHCGLCLPSCPTYEATLLEKNSPRGRIALMRAIADGRLNVTEAFADEIYFCLGCLACETACPAGVNYASLFEAARADAEQSGVLSHPRRDLLRAVLLRGLFTRPCLLRWVGRLLWLYQVSGGQSLVRALKLTSLLPKKLRELEPLTPTVRAQFSDALIRSVETPAAKKYRVGLLTGCVQDLLYSEVNRDTVDVLLAHGCEVITPHAQVCCGSLHAHNGELETARLLARRQLDAFDVEQLDAIVTNAAGCGTHLKTYGHLLHDDPVYAKKAELWSQKLKDIHEWLAQIGLRPPQCEPLPQRVTYHEACHLCHGQKITRAPRELLRAIPGLELIEMGESTWCCGSAGIYNITQPEMSADLLTRKLRHISATDADIVAMANPGCLVQIAAGLHSTHRPVRAEHTISLLARAYRRERPDPEP